MCFSRVATHAYAWLEGTVQAQNYGNGVLQLMRMHGLKADGRVGNAHGEGLQLMRMHGLKEGVDAAQADLTRLQLMRMHGLKETRSAAP